LLDGDLRSWFREVEALKVLYSDVPLELLETVDDLDPRRAVSDVPVERGSNLRITV
jgi:hypothetical protein